MGDDPEINEKEIFTDFALNKFNSDVEYNLLKELGICDTTRTGDEMGACSPKYFRFFKLKIGGRMQFRFDSADKNQEKRGSTSADGSEGVSHDFQTRRFQLTFSGYAYSPNIFYKYVICSDKNGTDCAGAGAGLGIEDAYFDSQQLRRRSKMIKKLRKCLALTMLKGTGFSL